MDQVGVFSVNEVKKILIEICVETRSREKIDRKRDSLGKKKLKKVSILTIGM